MTNPEFIFSAKYIELCDILDSLQVTRLLALSGILRIFLVDSPNIVDRVNRRYRLKILYPQAGGEPNHLNDWPKEVPKPTFVYVGFMPDSLSINKLTREQLLKQSAFFLNEEHYTYHQIIKLVANNLGGVHFDDNFKNHPELVDLVALNEQIGLGGAPSALWVMNDLGKVVREGLAELYAHVQAT